MLNELVLIDGALQEQALYIENFKSTRDVIKRIENLPNNSIEYEPDMLLPLPSETELTTDDFLTPFPFIIEMPILNLGNGMEDSIPGMLDDLGQCGPNRLKVI